MLAKPGIEPEINDIRKTFILITWKRTMLTPSRIWFGGHVDSFLLNVNHLNHTMFDASSSRRGVRRVARLDHLDLIRWMHIAHTGGKPFQ